MRVNEAIILAGGLGTRLRNAVPNIPKCMAPVNGQPFIAYVINYLQQQGVTNFVFSLGYLSESFVTFIENILTADSYTLVVEKEPLGTGGAIFLACKQAKSDNVIVTNGDSIFRADISKLFSFHEQKQAECTIALKQMENFDRYGVVSLDEMGKVVSFQEKQFYSSGLINGGLYILNKKTLLKEKFPEKFSFEIDYLQQHYLQKAIYGISQEGYFIDIGIPEDYQRAQKELI